MNRESKKEMRIMNLSLESIEKSIDYSWNEKWRDYEYTNGEKTGLILNNLKLGMELRDDLMKVVIDTLIVLNSDDISIQTEINEFRDTIMSKKAESEMEKKRFELAY